MYGETWALEAERADGTTDSLLFHYPWAVPERSNLGQPITEWVANLAFSGIGEQVQQGRLQPRQIILTVVRNEAQTTVEFYAIVERIHNVLRSNQYRETRLVITKADGSKRAIAVRPDPGFQLVQYSGDDYHISEPIGLIAHNPLFFNPVTTVARTTDVSGVV